MISTVSKLSEYESPTDSDRTMEVRSTNFSNLVEIRCGDFAITVSVRDLTAAIESAARANR